MLLLKYFQWLLNCPLITFESISEIALVLVASLFPTAYSLYPLFPQNKCTLGSATFLYPTFLEMPFP